MTNLPTWFGRWPAPAQPTTSSQAPATAATAPTPIKDIGFIKRPTVVVKRPAVKKKGA